MCTNVQATSAACGSVSVSCVQTYSSNARTLPHFMRAKVDNYSTPSPPPPPPPPPANLRGVQRHTLCTKHGQSKVTVSVLSLRMPTITSVLLYVTRLVSIVCYKNHNPFFPQEFEIEHWKEMKAKLLLSITL